MMFSLKSLMFSASLSLLATQAGATPVTYLYDSGSFTSSPRAQSALFGTHFTAELTFSEDLIPGRLGVDYLNRISQVGNAPGPLVVYQHATLLDWTVTSGSFTLNPGNATITSDVYTYTSAGTGNLPQLFFSFEAAANGIVSGGSLPVSVTARPDLNITQGIGPYPGSNFSLRNFNLGGGITSKIVRAGGGGGGADGAGGVPEPTNWALMICGFGMVGGAMRRHSLRLAPFC